MIVDIGEPGDEASTNIIDVCILHTKKGEDERFLER